MGWHPAAAAARRCARVANGLTRGVFIGCGRPSVHTTRLATRTGGAAGRWARAASSACRAVGSGTVSSSISQIRSAPSARASAMPAAKPPAPPVFCPSTVSRAAGNDSRTAAAVPSVEALSITSTASAGRVCPSTAASDSSSSGRRL